MEKAENLDHGEYQTFRGHSGWEAPSVDENKTSWRTIGIILTALLVLAGVFLVPHIENKNFEAPIAVRCVDNSACRGLTGDCCPTSDGHKLECCTAGDNVVTPTLTSPGACDDNSACASLGLLGACCPNSNGIHLQCCSSPNNTRAKPHAVSATCERNFGCRAQGVHGNCCPTDDGLNLACCPPTSQPSRPA